MNRDRAARLNMKCLFCQQTLEQHEGQYRCTNSNCFESHWSLPYRKKLRKIRKSRK